MADYKYSLKITGPDGFKLDFAVPIGITRIGRQAGNDIVLPHSQVSRGHARIETTASECHIADLGSSNGTKRRGEKFTANVPMALKNGDIVTIGPFEIAVSGVKVETHQTREIEPPVIDPSIVSSVEPAPDPPPIRKEKPAPAAEEKKASSEKPKEEKPAAKRKAPAKKPATRRKTTAAQKPPPPPPVDPPATVYANGNGTGIPGQTIHSSKLLPYLPGIYHTDFMSRFLGIFEATLLPIEWTVDNFDQFLSPSSAPADFLPWLASWFGITFDSTWSEKQQKTLLEEAQTIYARRGTAWALSRVLEIYTGVKPEIDDTTKSLDPFTFRVAIPLQKRDVNLGLIEALIEAHKPAHTDYSLSFKR